MGGEANPLGRASCVVFASPMPNAVAHRWYGTLAKLINRVPKYVPNSADLIPTRPIQLDEIVPSQARPASNIALVMKGSPVQVRASALRRPYQST